MYLKTSLLCITLSTLCNSQIHGYYPVLQGGGALLPIGLVGGGANLVGGGANLGVGGGNIGVGGGNLGLVGGGLVQGGGGLIQGGGGLIGGGGGGLIGSPLLYKGYGGEAIEKSQYDEGKKNINDHKYEKQQGKKGEEVEHGEHGYHEGKVLEKDVKGQQGYYNEAEGGKKIDEDEKKYHGGQHFEKGGKEGEEKKYHKGHKKGHVIKGYKNSHHKDETGRTEEYYDEANDEGAQFGFKGQNGQFGANGASSFKGAHADEEFKKGEKKNEGHFNQEHLVGKEEAKKGKFGEQKYANQNSIFGAQNGAAIDSLLGHHESSKFYKHVPFFG